MTELSEKSIDARGKIFDIQQQILDTPEFNSNPESARDENGLGGAGRPTLEMREFGPC